jgi:hypothetical protein
MLPSPIFLPLRVRVRRELIDGSENASSQLARWRLIDIAFVCGTQTHAALV